MGQIGNGGARGRRGCFSSQGPHCRAAAFAGSRKLRSNLNFQTRSYEVIYMLAGLYDPHSEISPEALASFRQDLPSNFGPISMYRTRGLLMMHGGVPFDRLSAIER